MTATQIIREVDCLPPAERLAVVRYATQLDPSSQLSGAELGVLAQRLVNAQNPAEVVRLKAEITKGFYGAA